VHAILLARVAHDVANDLAQEVFLQAWTTIRTLRDPAAFPGWIGAIARHRALDVVRRRPLETELVEGRSADASPDLQYEAAEALDAIRDLPEAYREPLMLRLVEGCSGREIAALCGLTEESVRVNLHRGFKLLRERMGARSLEHEH
jgi:RNA polymerase sigma-70 factor (ECF subfamily)